jgi:Arc/MetJ-type ribon-helix-helix transcriptional regulator
MNDPRETMKTIRFSKVEADLLERSARAHGMNVSDVVREAVIYWREHVGDRAATLERWIQRLMDEHGDSALLTVRMNDVFSADVEINGEEPGDFMAEAVHDRGGQVQLWVGDPETDARAFLGRVPALAGAAITVPLKAVPGLGASDAHAV